MFSSFLKKLYTFFLFSAFIISIKSITINPPISLNLNCFAHSFAASKLIFNDVSFRYQTDKKVLKKLKLEIKPGQLLGIVGSTGSIFELKYPEFDIMGSTT